MICTTKSLFKVVLTSSSSHFSPIMHFSSFMQVNLRGGLELNHYVPEPASSSTSRYSTLWATSGRKGRRKEIRRTLKWDKWGGGRTKTLTDRQRQFAQFTISQVRVGSLRGKIKELETKNCDVNEFSGQIGVFTSFNYHHFGYNSFYVRRQR